MTYFEVSKIVSEVLGRDIVYANPSARQYSQRMLAQGIEKPFVRVMGRIYCIARWGLAAGVTPELQQLLKQPPTTMEQFVRDHVDVWR